MTAAETTTTTDGPKAKYHAAKAKTFRNKAAKSDRATDTASFIKTAEHHEAMAVAYRKRCQ